jgi:hypothetical protein
MDRGLDVLGWGIAIAAAVGAKVWVKSFGKLLRP